MFTIVTSRTTISWAMPMTTRISHRRSWWGAVLSRDIRSAPGRGGWVCTDDDRARTDVTAGSGPTDSPNSASGQPAAPIARHTLGSPGRGVRGEERGEMAERIASGLTGAVRQGAGGVAGKTVK